MTKEEILKFLEEKKAEFKKKYHIKEIGLYGSYSRNEQNEHSDIDIVYVLDDGEKFGYFEFLELEEILSQQFNKNVELVNYQYMNPIIKYNAKKEIIYV
ncbi:MAG: nucleotidyltransferase [Candidatus Aminicenantes bacterium]|nr:nucleotidyltransferase [Candidatus Aminicenantes bacterium]NIM78649.1 nucleotidyltransferase [Candidatus Aminicenantes bacterium]NIN17896.1 nucleotidyltransferase [Candidatus Aminicenantes bacterium]NIN41799.1 nucleotidyltransferase [Candidatus Aminicenantes bacterium]NIN84551.1 nucleotidyltransferase [Candidatus Aminicenantes bacterium]